MNIGVLGTGMVGETIGSALIAKGHSVKMGSRVANNDKALVWSKKEGKHASNGLFSDAANFGEVIFVCLNGEFALDVIKSIPPEYINGKIVVDITNPLDFTQGMPPKLLPEFSNSTSLGEAIQNAIPGAFVVKTLNTINCKLMVNASMINNGDHHLFVCGNDIDAKNNVKHILVDNFNWKADHLIDLGDITNARIVEAIVPFWVSVWQALGTPLFNFKIVQ